MSSVDIGIDLGTANTIITLGGKRIIDEPSIVAFDKKKREVLAVGADAYSMLGRTPEYIVAVKPLKDGVISDSMMVEVMIKEFIRKVGGNLLIKPQVVLCVPSLVTDVERRALVEAALGAGARKIFLIDEPVAALIGAGIDIRKPRGAFVVDIGGGTTDIAVVSFNGIVDSTSIKMAGNKMDSAIVKFIQQKHKVLIGEKTAEHIKVNVSNVFDPSGKSVEAKGRNLIRGLPERITVTDYDVKEALGECMAEIIQCVKSVFEKIPPELAGDILASGIVLTGGGAMIGGIDQIISEATKVPCIIADDPVGCVARGVARAFEFSDELLDGFQKISLYRYK